MSAYVGESHRRTSGLKRGHRTYDGELHVFGFVTSGQPHPPPLVMGFSYLKVHGRVMTGGRIPFSEAVAFELSAGIDEGNT